MADHPHGSNMDPRELAYQIVDIVHLRPEIELCYMGLAAKCFEILENRPRDYDLRGDAHGHADLHSSGAYVAVQDPMLSDEESEATEDEDDDDEDGGVGDGGMDGGIGGHGDDESDINSESERDDSEGESEFDEGLRGGPRLRVREILFYEERVEAFRRRHGSLRP